MRLVYGLETEDEAHILVECSLYREVDDPHGKALPSDQPCVPSLLYMRTNDLSLECLWITLQGGKNGLLYLMFHLVK